MPYVARITLRPVKGLDGVAVESARVGAGGALENDRRWRLVDADRRELVPHVVPLLARVRSTVDLASRSITLWIGGDGVGAGPPARVDSFPLRPGPDGPCPWLSRTLGIGVHLEERPDGGYPDDPDAPGPTVASTASLEEVARWFSLPPDLVRRRLGPGLEIDDCAAFWEDTLACPASRPSVRGDGGDDPWGTSAPPPEPRSFVVGETLFSAVGVRPLLDVDALDPATGRPIEHFREIFEAWRRRSARVDVDASQWGGRFRLAATTVGGGRGGEVRVGDRIVPVAHLV